VPLDRPELRRMPLAWVAALADGSQGEPDRLSGWHAFKALGFGLSSLLREFRTQAAERTLRSPDFPAPRSPGRASEMWWALEACPSSPSGAPPGPLRVGPLRVGPLCPPHSGQPPNSRRLRVSARSRLPMVERAMVGMVGPGLRGGEAVANAASSGMEGT
jgi:hypothetical protein